MGLRFGDLTLDLETRQLLRDGAEVRLTPKAFELLKLLVESRPRAFSKSELLNQLWPNTFVVESNLVSLISEIREATGDNARRPKFIRTVQRFGYAFSGAASESDVRTANRAAGLGSWIVWEARQVPLTEGENIVGREPEAAVWLDDATVSRRHARILISGPEATVEDLGSKNGTWLRGVRLSAPATVLDGDEIRIGSVAVKFRRPPSTGSTAPLDSTDQA